VTVRLVGWIQRLEHQTWRRFDGVRAAVVECLGDLVLAVLDDEECATAVANRGVFANPNDLAQGMRVEYERGRAENEQGDDR